MNVGWMVACMLATAKEGDERRCIGEIIAVVFVYLDALTDRATKTTV